MVSLPEYTVHQTGDINTLSQVAHWGITDLDIPSLWKISQGEDVVVAVLDTGVPSHNDLDENILFKKCRSFVTNEFGDKNGHATHVSGIIGSINNSYGVVGVAPKCKLVCIKVLSDNGMATERSILDGLQYCIDIKPDVVNMSLGSREPMPAVLDLIKKLVYMGIPVVCSAGNNGEKKDKSVMYPAIYDEVIAVGSYSPTTITSKSLFSSVGPEVDLAAPGDQILSTYTNNQYGILSGTSQSAPVISGIIALLISYYKKHGIAYTVQTIRNDLIRNCKDVGKNGIDDHFGWGIISPKNIFNQSQIQSINNISWWKKILMKIGLA